METVEYRGISRKSMEHRRNIIEYGGISWDIMEYRGIARCTMDYYGILLDIVEYLGIPEDSHGFGCKTKENARIATHIAQFRTFSRGPSFSQSWALGDQ